jgi:serine/threonine protein kinase/TolB-like protein/Tfp pilus assembly protein PilF
MRIDPGAWPTLSALLDEYLDQPNASRAVWLANLGPEYADILPTLREVVSKGTARGDAFLDTLPAVTTLDGVTGYAPLAPGSLVGPYRLIRELGRGGMSLVWLAERVDGLLKRKVALKLPIVLLDNDTLVERFARERDILARLTHPQIARLYDAGVTASGKSYLVLEYVEGEPITPHCDRHGLNLKARLELFLEVLRAVEYAHNHGVVHRDLKPSNILVSSEGEIRLLDFGIAKLLVKGEAEATELTRVGGRALTPEYASPEQLAGRPVTTASDVFSLGVVLFELLTGENPRKHTRDADPVRPSQAVARNEETGHQTNAQARGLDRKRLAAGLRGDLDTIVLRALRDAPAERYPTPGELARDIERYLTGKPILARPRAGWYRLGKFVRRKRAAVTAAAGVTLALGLALSLAFWESERAWRAETVAAARAPQLAAQAELLLVLPFENQSGDPDQDSSSDGLTEETIAQLRRLDPQRLGVIARTTAMHYKGARLPADRIARELGVQYIVDGSLQRRSDQVVLAARLLRVPDRREIWTETFDRPATERLVLESEAAGAIARGVGGALNLERPLAASATAVDPRAHAEYVRGRYYWNKRAGDDYRRAIEHFQRALDIDPAYARAYAGLADCYLLLTDDVGRDPSETLAKAAAAARKALDIDSSLVEAHTSLALTLMKQWHWAESEREYRRAIELDLNYATAHHWYAEYLNCEGRFDDALQEIGRAGTLDPLSPMIATDRGKILHYARRQPEAIAQLKRVLQEYPAFAEAHHFLARAYAAAGRYDEALAAIDRYSDKTQNPLEFMVRGYVLARMGRRAEALQTAADMRRRGWGEPYMIDLGLGDNDRALARLEASIEIWGPTSTSLKVDPIFDGVRVEPRFQRLLERMGLAQ